MRQTTAGLVVDHYPPESTKFRSPIVFVHGLWSGAWCWESWATHFCNLGWECFAINLRGRFEENPLRELQRLRFQDCVGDLTAVLENCAHPPIVVGLNLGASLALMAAQRGGVSSLVLVSPARLPGVADAIPRGVRLLRLKYLPLLWLNRPFQIEPKDFSNYFLNGLPQTSLCQRTVAESTLLVREFFSPSIAIGRKPVACPILMLAGGDDSLIPLSFHKESAHWLDAELKEYPSRAHWLIEGESEAIVWEIHRWLIHALEDSIILSDIG